MSTGQVDVRMFALADGDAAGQCSLVVVDAVVGDLEVVAPAVDQDAAAALGTVGDGQAVDARRVAPEVARERIVCSSCIPPATSALLLVASPSRSRVPVREHVGSERIRSGGNAHALASTVMPAPSYAPISVGSCSCSARLPLSVASQPTWLRGASDPPANLHVG